MHHILISLQSRDLWSELFIGWGKKLIHGSYLLLSILKEFLKLLQRLLCIPVCTYINVRASD